MSSDLPVRSERNRASIVESISSGETVRVTATGSPSLWDPWNITVHLPRAASYASRMEKRYQVKHAERTLRVFARVILRRGRKHALYIYIYIYVRARART